MQSPITAQQQSVSQVWIFVLFVSFFFFLVRTTMSKKIVMQWYLTNKFRICASLQPSNQAVLYTLDSIYATFIQSVWNAQHASV